MLFFEKRTSNYLSAPLGLLEWMQLTRSMFSGHPMRTSGAQNNCPQWNINDSKIVERSKYGWSEEEDEKIEEDENEKRRMKKNKGKHEYSGFVGSVGVNGCIGASQVCELLGGYLVRETYAQVIACPS